MCPRLETLAKGYNQNDCCCQNGLSMNNAQPIRAMIENQTKVFRANLFNVLMLVAGGGAKKK